MRMKKTASIVVIAGALILIALGVANAAYPSLASGYAVDSNYHGINVPPGSSVEVTAYTTDSDVNQVTFLWKNPEGNIMKTEIDDSRTQDGTYNSKIVYTFNSSFSPEATGDWGVQALFQDSTGKTKQKIDNVLSIKATSFFVIPDVPVLGTVGSLAAMFLGLGMFAKRRR